MRIFNLLILLVILSGCSHYPIVNSEEQTGQPLLSQFECQYCMIVPPSKNPKFSIDAIYFDTAKHSLKPSSVARIDEIVKAIQHYKPVSVFIEGGADARGSHPYNFALSDRRANAIKQALIERGISENLLFTKGYGKTQPVAPNHNKEGRRLNRRVDITLNLQ
jgi:outer membrane protein OmpA-like peptidoglycan-associated protein